MASIRGRRFLEGGVYFTFPFSNFQEKKPNANIIVSGLLPRDQEISSRRDKITLVNQKLRKWCRSGKVRNVHYLKPDKDWTEPDERLVER